MNSNILHAAIIFGVFVTVSIVIQKALKKVEKHYDASTSESFRLISNSQKAVLIFTGIVLALSKLGFDVSALVAGLGLTGFALGIALKDAISNLVAGIMIVLYKTVELGNVIEMSNTKGKIVDINLRYITLEVDEVIHMIPNALFLNNKIAIFNKQKLNSVIDQKKDTLN